MNDREFWIAIRAALLGIVDAIERRWRLGRHAVDAPPPEVVEEKTQKRK